MTRIHTLCIFRVIYIISEHNLLIEKGRHLNIPREQRLCSHCKYIDDEKHFLLHCTINSELRSSFLNILNNENQIFNNLSESEKLSYILNPSTPSQVNNLGSFLKKSLELRILCSLCYMFICIIVTNCIV